MNKAFTTDWAACGLDYGTGHTAFTAVPPKSMTGECILPKKRGPKPISKLQQSIAALSTPQERQAAREARILRDNANTFVFASATEADKAKAFRLTGRGSLAGFEK